MSMKNPVVLREKQGGTYALVDICYLHGISDGSVLLRPFTRQMRASPLSRPNGRGSRDLSGIPHHRDGEGYKVVKSDSRLRVESVLGEARCKL